MLTQQETTVNAELPFRYLIGKSEKPKAILIFLHGFQDHSASFMKRLFKSDYSELNDYTWIAPNGPFPVPVRTESGWKEAYSWYFLDTKKDRMLIPPNTAINGITSILNRLPEMQAKLPIHIIGFSQGGFLAGFLLQKLGEQVRSVIGLGSQFPKSNYELPSAIRKQIQITGLSGDKDEIFLPKTIQDDLENLAKMGYSTRFELLENTPHITTAEMGQKLIEILDKSI